MSITRIVTLAELEGRLGLAETRVVLCRALLSLWQINAVKGMPYHPEIPNAPER